MSFYQNPIKYCNMAIYCNTLKHNMQYSIDPYCFTPNVYITFRLLMEGGMVRLYRILRVMPQPAINIAKICFVTNYGKSRNYNYLNNNILYHLLGGIYGPLTCHSKSQLGPCTITFPERNGDPT